MSDAVSCYWEWISSRQLICIDSNETEKEAERKGSLIGSILHSLKYSKMIRGNKTTVDLDVAIVGIADKVHAIYTSYKIITICRFFLKKWLFC